MTYVPMQRLLIFQGKSRGLVDARRSPRGSPQSYPQIDPKGPGHVNQWFSGGSSSAAFGNSAKSGLKTGGDATPAGGRCLCRRVGRTGAGADSAPIRRTIAAHGGGAPSRPLVATCHCGVLATRRGPGRVRGAQAGPFREWSPSVNCFTDTDKPCRALSN